MGVHHQLEMILMKSECGSLEPEVSCGAHKLLKVWNGIGQLIEEIDLKLFEKRDGDPRKKSFQVSAGTLEPKPAEVRKCDMCHDRRTQQLSLDVAAGIVGGKGDPE
jgi:hypothetical protein